MDTASDNFTPVMAHRNNSEESQKTLSELAQQIVDDLNAKRKADETFISNFKAKVQAQVEKVCQAAEQHMYQVYEKQGPIFNDKIQELFQCLERIQQLEEEHETFKQGMKSFLQEIN